MNSIYIRSFYGETGGALRSQQISNIYNAQEISYNKKYLSYFVNNILRLSVLIEIIKSKSLLEFKWKIGTLFRNLDYRDLTVIIDVHFGSTMVLPCMLRCFGCSNIVYIAHNAESLNRPKHKQLPLIEKKNSSLCQVKTISEPDNNYFKDISSNVEFLPFELLINEKETLRNENKRNVVINISARNFDILTIKNLIEKHYSDEDLIFLIGPGTEVVNTSQIVGLGFVSTATLNFMITTADLLTVVYPRKGGFPTKVLEYEKKGLKYSFIGPPEVLNGYNLVHWEK